MRFVTFEYKGQQSIGLLNDDQTRVIDLASVLNEKGSTINIPSTLLEAIDLGETFIDEVTSSFQWLEKRNIEDYSFYLKDPELRLLAPIPRPSKNIFCVGKNYAAHAIEMGSAADIPEHLLMFTKAPTTVIGTEETVFNHAHITSQLDYEGEIAVIIGKKGTAIKEEEAYDYIFGYTLLNDITARDLQKKHKQFFLGKSLDTTCPMGPWITHSSLVKDSVLKIETKVNGELRQKGSIDQMIFSIPTILSVISQGMTLEPGDIIATGTPSGVGSGFSPPKYLKSGDEIEIRVDELGVLTNTIQ
ncbi:fumarylacetoacetate hydrolase family protein [Alkalihalobacterium chitinilyticum]|uniref:Fumarylacetoacetate hydrolase family protein n=1 Tax=Alkalihalobacterium chitinilyticum TaxID=2980103 RepID=A0ABT5VAS9_9BACI|nr:fumarylacetoacetate hydrolase family protein [Alkalihalobacterium chitinilyticum]MDE5412554.1 fumarylacetoacetate hydrolase family protein [Alkalihalobacterium chitinilyticum]